MRIRRKKWAEKELQEAKFYIDKPEVNKGKWKEYFKNEAPLYIELGCGKGLFIATLAVNHKDINFSTAEAFAIFFELRYSNLRPCNPANKNAGTNSNYRHQQIIRYIIHQVKDMRSRTVWQSQLKVKIIIAKAYNYTEDKSYYAFKDRCLRS